jgi:hydroxymethylpyrimidine/phosphomethylpyrimidine kinase
MSFPNILSISISDPFGAVGVQGDIKTFMALETYGVSVITSIQMASEVSLISAATIESQIKVALSIGSIQAIKLGGLPDVATIECVAMVLSKLEQTHIICDPECFLVGTVERERWFEAFKRLLLPLVSVLVINVDEVTEWIESSRPTTENEMISLISELRKLNVPTIVFTGGHLDETHCTDLLIEPNQVQKISTERSKTLKYTGAGSALSAGITAYLAKGFNEFDAVFKAKKFVTMALANSMELDLHEKSYPLNHGFDKKHQ